MSLTLRQVEAKLGQARPTGDPQAMRDAATALTGIAIDLRGQRDAMAKTVLTGSGRLVERTNDRVDTRRKVLLHGALELEDVASKLTLRAEMLQGSQDAWNRAASKLGWKG